MIKIEIPNKAKIEAEFFDLIEPVVKERAKLMLISLKHLNGGVIDVEEGDINKYKHIVSKIANKLGNGVKITSKKITKATYKSKINAVLRNGKIGSDLAKLNFNNLFIFINDLLDPKGVLLRNILICEASKLYTTNEAVLKKYNITDKLNIEILKLVFDYKNHDISSKLKSFYRDHNFINYCPYCNLTEVKFISTPKKTRVATSHQLDHFFDKGKHPLLACSLFNLIPSDSTCNGTTNKGGILFSDKYHLNPYIRGFKKDLVFFPVMKGLKVDEIKIRINAKKGTIIRKQMLGSSEEINGDKLANKKHEEGNVNVFTLESKYYNRIEEAQRVIDSIKARDNGISSVKNYFKKMKGLNLEKVYIKWYKSKMRTSLDSKKFGENAYSKFNRDIHDYYYEIELKRRNNFIYNIINKND